jgi:hypothetical protein
MRPLLQIKVILHVCQPFDMCNVDVIFFLIQCHYHHMYPYNTIIVFL